MDSREAWQSDSQAQDGAVKEQQRKRVVAYRTTQPEIWSNLSWAEDEKYINARRKLVKE